MIKVNVKKNLSKQTWYARENMTKQVNKYGMVQKNGQKPREPNMEW